MYNFTFNIPTKIHFGKDTISSLSELKAYGSKVLLEMCIRDRYKMLRKMVSLSGKHLKCSEW